MEKRIKKTRLKKYNRKVCPKCGSDWKEKDKYITLNVLGVFPSLNYIYCYGCGSAWRSDNGEEVSISL